MERLQSVWQWIREHLLAVIGVTLLVLGFGAAIGGSLYNGNTLREAVEAFYANAGTELISIALTVLVIEALNHRRAIRKRKDELILQMGSPDNAFAIEAARILRQKGWLTDGSLREAWLEGANLQKAILGADMRGKREGADLRGAHMSGAKLQKARLRGVDLQGARLGTANLQGAILLDANLQGAGLGFASLREARLELANLQGALFVTCDQLRQARTLKGVTLPDGTELPNDDTWRKVFEAWCETIKTDSRYGWIILAETDNDRKQP